MPYSPSVERWRSLVAKYFPPELVDKALYVIQGESGGDPAARGDNGVAIGLFQIQDKTNFENRPDATYLSDPERNIAYAAQQLGGASGNFSAWGEGATHKGKPFGALGNNPYPGTTGATSMPGGRYYADPEMDAEFEELRRSTREAYDAFVAAGRPMDGEEWFRLDDAQQRLDQWINTHEGFRLANSDPAERAQTDFENTIRLGDYNRDQADSAFSRWLNTTQEARMAATTEQNARAQHNADLVALQEARNTSPTSSQLPMPIDAGYMEVGFDELLKRHESRLGVGRFDPDVVPGTLSSYPGSEATAARLPTGAAGDIWNAAKTRANAGPTGDPENAMLYSSANQAMRRADGSASGTAAAPREGWRDILGGLALRAPAATMLGPGAGAVSLGYAGYQALNRYGGGAMSGARAAGSKAKNAVTSPWWKRAYAQGGRNIPGGPGWVGDGGRPEILEVPGFGAKIVGADGPEEIQIPEGANVIPLDEAMVMQQIRQAAATPPRNSSSPAEQAARAADPQLQQKVLASLRKAMAANMAAHPPFTPTLESPAMKDYFAAERPLTGVPAYAQPVQAVKR